LRRYRLHTGKAVGPDLDGIEEHLAQTYLAFGDDAERARSKSEKRVDDAVAYLRTFETVPHKGTHLPHIRDGLRSVTHHDFIVYFEIDEARNEVTILAVFFRGTDHRRQIIDRL
jgi:toxin ParE1/3/4